jgi:CheY-like chemotaxis protein
MTRKTVLIVDDDVDIREVLAETLAEVGYGITTACNGREALAALRRMNLRPTVILLDLMMPIMDGYGFLQQRRMDPALASIPLAIVTAGHGIDRERLGDDLPILRKPFDVPELLGMVDILSSEGRLLG